MALRTIENALVLDLLTDADGRTRGRHPARHGRGPARRRGRRARPRGGPRHRRHGPGLLRHHQPVRSPPATAWRSPCARAPRSPTSSSCSSTRPCCSSAPDAEGQQPLVSEAVRGEGAHLVDADGVRFMVGQHELAELAPRDIVAKGIMRRMQEQDAEHMFLDARHFGADMWEHRFPTILAACRAHGIDPVTEPIPIAPAAHYASGGVRTDSARPYDRPRPVRLRRGRLHRRARREPARLQLPPGGPRLRRAHRRRHRGDATRTTASTRACPSRSRTPRCPRTRCSPPRPASRSSGS